jgi:hypothetical protein
VPSNQASLRNSLKAGRTAFALTIAEREQISRAPSTIRRNRPQKCAGASLTPASPRFIPVLGQLLRHPREPAGDSKKAGPDGDPNPYGHGSSPVPVHMREGEAAASSPPELATASTVPLPLPVETRERRRTCASRVPGVAVPQLRLRSSHRALLLVHGPSRRRSRPRSYRRPWWSRLYAQAS